MGLRTAVLFTVPNLVITDVFPEETHALAGAVFNTISQFGTSLGVAIRASISFPVTSYSHYPVKTSLEALMQGYRVTFWVGLGCMLAVCVVGLVGLRKAGTLETRIDSRVESQASHCVKDHGPSKVLLRECLPGLTGVLFFVCL